MVRQTTSSELVVAANRLPVHRENAAGRSDRWRISPGGLVTGLSAIMAARDSAWVGWHGLAGSAPDPFRAEGITLVPVDLTVGERDSYYRGMSNATLWPLYHGALRRPVVDPQWWDPYVRVNQRFARAAAEAAAPGGTVWVHDYHLQLVPALVRSHRRDVNISFFFHTPFPPLELLARLPWCKEFISGVLGADVVGLQTPRDVENFLSICSRLFPSLTLDRGEAANVQVRYEGRVIDIGAYPISIDVVDVQRQAGEARSHERAAELRAQLGNPRRVLLGVDRLDYTKGIDARLEALTISLRRGDIDPTQIAFIQIASPSRDDVVGYDAIRERVERQVSNINGEFSSLGRPVVHYLHQTLSFSDLVPLYLAADVMVVTPHRDGMNLVAKEYAACRLDDSGVLVLSEFAGAAEELRTALLCNPFDTEGLAHCLQHALTIDRDDARHRMRAMREVVEANDVYRWANRLLSAGRTSARR